ncbi:hypothetical protein BJX61DRAFT_105579 [Aspergillus egyptiacus]|nr:hypothetical protein BJX61DRAFT_105579 [Aspergillus egyptiacus]
MLSRKASEHAGSSYDHKKPLTVRAQSSLEDSGKPSISLEFLDLPEDKYDTSSDDDGSFKKRALQKRKASPCSGTEDNSWLRKPRHFGKSFTNLEASPTFRPSSEHKASPQAVPRKRSRISPTPTPDPGPVQCQDTPNSASKTHDRKPYNAFARLFPRQTARISCRHDGKILPFPLASEMIDSLSLLRQARDDLLYYQKVAKTRITQLEEHEEKRKSVRNLWDLVDVAKGQSATVTSSQSVQTQSRHHGKVIPFPLPPDTFDSLTDLRQAYDDIAYHVEVVRERIVELEELEERKLCTSNPWNLIHVTEE